MKKYRYMLAGGTAFAAGMAAALAQHDESVCIFDRGSLVGGEFAAAFKGEPMLSYQPITDIGKKFKAELVNRRMISERGDSYAALEPIFCRFLADYHGKVDFLACTNPILDEYSGSGRRLELSFIGGVYGFECDILLDTTSKGRSVKYSLNAMLKCDGIPKCGDHIIIPGCFDDEYYLHFPTESDYTAAREGLYSSWRSRSAELYDAELLYIADRFDETCANALIKLDECRYSLPSVGFASALEALDMGAAFAEESEVLK